MRLYKLDKTVFCVRNDAAEFLKAYTTNTLDAPRNAFVDVHGRIVAVIGQRMLNHDEVLIAVGRPFAGRLLKHLEKYLALGRTQFKEEDYFVYFNLNGDYEPGEEEWVISQAPGQWVITKKNLNSGVSTEEFTLFRVKNRMPVQGIDYDDTLLLNVHDEDHVSYTKGCYLGQEIIARVHSRSRPPKKLVVKSEAECSPEEFAQMTSRVMDPSTGKKIGFVFVNNVIK